MIESLRLLGRNGSPNNGCPALYEADPGSFLIVGWVTRAEGTVEIPHVLLGFADAREFIGATLTDTGRGTFTLDGEPVTDPADTARLEMADDETAIIVPRCERKYFGAAA
ncbi:hypothetical protein [Nocardia heshunensis]